MRLRSNRVILLFAGECESHRHFRLRDLLFADDAKPEALQPGSAARETHREAHPTSRWPEYCDGT